MSLPASPTMLQYQLPSGYGAASGGHSISPSSGSWPDMDMEQPLAPQLAGAALTAAPAPGGNGDNGDALLWPSAHLVAPHSSSAQLLHQPGVPLGLQLRLSGAMQQQFAAAAAAAAAGTLGHRLPADAAMLHQARQEPCSSTMVPQLQQQQQQHQRLQDQQLMPPPLPLQPGNAATRSSMLSNAPRPPPLIIPSTQPTLVQPLQQPAAGPTPSPAQPRSGTSVTPAMLSMGLADCAAAVQSAAAAAPDASAAAARTEEGIAGSRQRRQRRRASVPSSPAGAAAAAAAPSAPNGAAALLAAARRHVKVVCGSLLGWMDVRDCLVLVAAGQGVEEVKVNPSIFESLAGKGATRKWRQSLTVLPDGPDDEIVPQPIPLGEFMKLHQLEKSIGNLQAQGRSTAAAAAAADDAPLPSPATVRHQHHSLVSPGVRRRRQQLGSQGSSSQEQDWDVDDGGSDDQPQAHVKRSKGSKPQQQQQQQQQHWRSNGGSSSSSSFLHCRELTLLTRY
ncbi:hypothetical protein COO60DRAFT_1163440 [Scenedesmus sp. NREL 46B-D3]|nr:hypothetical protein COO60DRAFT_1163440 [Scenedesmus sp. NREL 46B-D3]